MIKKTRKDKKIKGKKQTEKHNAKHNAKQNAKQTAKQNAKQTAKHNTKRNAKGLTHDLRETKFLIKNLNEKIPSDISQKITRNYSHNLIILRKESLLRKKALLRKLVKYKNIVKEIHSNYKPDDLYDDGYNYLNNKKYLIDIEKQIKDRSITKITLEFENNINKQLHYIYEEIKDMFEIEYERNPHSDLSIMLDAFLIDETNFGEPQEVPPHPFLLYS
jgi:hypothetical protein